MINKDIIEAFSAVAKEKNIDRTNLSTIIEDLFKGLIEKKYGEKDNFSVIVNMDKGEVEIYQEMVIVDDVDDPVVEIDIKEAQKVESDLEIGDPFIKVLDPEQFGRRLINSAKQHLSQKIRDIEKETIYEQFHDRVGEVITGTIHQIQHDRVFVLCDQIEMVLNREDQIPGDRYKRGETIRSIIKSVEINSKGPDIKLSRSDNMFLERLFEMEIPEIEDGIIEVKSVSRVAGDRSKIVVFSSDQRIDAVGACVGMRGSRIQSVVRELNGEKIDIINWSDQSEILISRSLSPAKPLNLYVDDQRSYVVAVFEDEELPIAIGRNGQNIKLASDVSGYNIDAVKKSDYEGSDVKLEYIDEMPFISKAITEELAKLEIHTNVDWEEAEREILLKVKGLGVKTIDKIDQQIKDLSLKSEVEIDSQD